MLEVKARWYEEGEKNTKYYFALENLSIMLRHVTTTREE